MFNIFVTARDIEYHGKIWQFIWDTCLFTLRDIGYLVPLIQASQAYHDQNLESSLEVVLICRFCLPSMLANIHVYRYMYILNAVTIFSFLVIYRKF